MMTRLLSGLPFSASLAFLVLLAPSQALAQWWEDREVIYYTFPDSPPRPLVTIQSTAFPCQGGDKTFAREAEPLIATQIDRQRAELAPGAPSLMADPQLIRIAQERSCNMAQGVAPFSHLDAAGHFIAGDMVHQAFGPYGVIGENISETVGTLEMPGMRPQGAREFAQGTVEAWIESPEHRANILDPRFDTSGVGVAKVGDQAVATQVFRGPAPKAKHGDP